MQVSSRQGMPSAVQQALVPPRPTQVVRQA
jgi:hypothetical protein